MDLRSKFTPFLPRGCSRSLALAWPGSAIQRASPTGGGPGAGTRPVAWRLLPELVHGCCFASKLQAAQAAGNTIQAQAIDSEDSQLIASPFNGATCPHVKTP